MMVGESSLDEPGLSIVVVNFNGRRFLDDCLNSVREFCSDLSYELILVDNASSDGSADHVAQVYPWVHLIRSERNLGFTGGNNLGARAARAPILLLLNNDTSLVQSLHPLLDAFSDPTLGAIGPHLVYGDKRLQYSVGYEHTPLRIVLSWLGLSRLQVLSTLFHRNETASSFYEVSHPSVDWISGACLMTRTDLWRKLQGLDEDFFMYCEDVDYCRRVRDAGYRVAYQAALTVIHYEGGGKAWIGSAAVRRSCRSYLLYVQKHYGALARMTMALPLAAVMGLRGGILAVLGLLARGERRALAREKSQAFLQVAAFIATTWSLEEQRGRM